MKKLLDICRQATNPQAPAPTASMLRIYDGRLEAFGGTFCVSGPINADVEAAFNPRMVEAFFRKERKGVTYTLTKTKLIIKSGKEKVSLPFLPAEDMAIIDVLGEPQKATLDKTHLRVFSNIVDPSTSDMWRQGVTFRYGAYEATCGYIVGSAVSGLPEDYEFNLPIDTVKVLLKIDEDVVGVALDDQAVKFYFESGLTLCSRIIPDLMPDIGRFFEGEWYPVDLKVADDLKDIDFERVVFTEGTAVYIADEGKGELSHALDPEVPIFALSRNALDPLLRTANDLLLHESKKRVQVRTDTCRIISSINTNTNTDV